MSETRANLSPMGRLYLKADLEGKGRLVLSSMFIWTLTFQNDTFEGIHVSK